MITAGLYLAMIVIEFLFIYLLYRLGKGAMWVMVAVNIILVSVLGAKLASVFGLVTNVGNVFYAAIFLCVNVVIEKYGKKEGYRVVWVGFFSLIFFLLLSQAVRLISGYQDSSAANEAIRVLFSLVPRLSFASIFAYLVAQMLNVEIYDFLLRISKGRFLAGRYLLSVSIADLVDSILFFLLAFGGVLSGNVLVQVLLVGYGFKTIVTISSLPILYLCNKVQKSDENLGMRADKPGERQPSVNEKETEYKIRWKLVNLVKISALVVGAIGVLAMAGWLFNVHVLLNFVEGMPTMKFLTAVSFVLAAVILYFVADNLSESKDLSSVVLPITNFTVVSIMLIFLASIMGIKTGMENLFFSEISIRQDLATPGAPSILTIIGFLVFSVVSLAVLAEIRWTNYILRTVGIILVVLGSMAGMGYLFGIPYLYMSIKGVSNPVAINTLFNLIILGSGTFLAGFIKKNTNETAG